MSAKKALALERGGGGAAVRAPNGIFPAVHHPRGTQGACPGRGKPQNRRQGAQGHGHNKQQKNRAFHTVRPKSELGGTKAIGGRKAAAFLPFVIHLIWAHNLARPPGRPPWPPLRTTLCVPKPSTAQQFFQLRLRSCQATGHWGLSEPIGWAWAGTEGPPWGNSPWRPNTSAADVARRHCRCALQRLPPEA